MIHATGVSRRVLSIIGFVASCFIGANAFAQSDSYLFPRWPTPTSAGAHASAALVGDVDLNVLAAAPERMILIVPGVPELLLLRESVEPRGQRNFVWRGKTAGASASAVTLTFHEGVLIGHVQFGSDSFVIRPEPRGRTIVEKIKPESFRPEWGHDHATRDQKRVPPTSGDTFPSTSVTSATSTGDAGSTTEIVLLSVYTPQARAAAGGATFIQAEIQAAVDQANTAFINSNMIARYFLAHTVEVNYNDSGNINADLDWVTTNAGVASLRNTYAADMVSLIVANGGGYCGVGWIQDRPSSGFAGYAFQVTDRDCMPNHTFAHEHGHNLGMEHNPENSDVGSTPSAASYPWSFGHRVDGQFRTVMAYDGCSAACPRILHFSNPDVAVNGYATGIADRRDNAMTGDLTAPIVAGFRSGGGVANQAPSFTTDPIVKPDAVYGRPYASSLSDSAVDPNGDPLTFAKTAGPAWLIVSANGSLSGTPDASDLGPNTFTVAVSDGRGGSASAKLNITVIVPLVAPTNLAALAVGSKRIDINWSYNGTGHAGFAIERSTNGKSFAPLTTVAAAVQSYSDTELRSGRKYYYRVRAYNGSNNSSYSNIASSTAR